MVLAVQPSFTAVLVSEGRITFLEDVSSSEFQLLTLHICFSGLTQCLQSMRGVILAAH